MADGREILTWDDFGTATRVLAQDIVNDYEPDMILSIARGGLLIGGALGYALGIKNTYTMNVEFYTGVDERLEVPRILPPAPDFVDLADARILIADDVADTGHTLRSVEEFVAGKVGEVRTAVLFETPLDRPLRLRVEAHRPVDQLPMEHAAAGVAARRCCGSPDRPRRLRARRVAGARMPVAPGGRPAYGSGGSPPVGGLSGVSRRRGTARRPSPPRRPP